MASRERKRTQRSEIQSIEKQALKTLEENLPPGLAEQWEKKIFDLEQLVHISKALSSNLDYDALIDNILNITLAQSRSLQTGIFASLEGEFHEITFHPRSIGFEFDHANPPKISLKSEFGRFLLNHCPRNTGIFILDLEKKAQGAHANEIAMLKSLSEELVLFPLRGKGGNRLVGLLVIGPRVDGSPYMADIMRFLADLSSIAAIAVENARLYLLATTDMMTRLKIHHFFQTQLREMREEAKETNRPLSLIMTDIDHFKKFNDTYGHLTGDIVLKNVARIIMDNVTPEELCARYGGEEFAVILPGKDLQIAQRMAEKLRQAVENSSVENPTDIGDKNLKVTISLGVTTYLPEKDRENADIIERCDKALYQAKRNGRNRVEVVVE
ncbi:MAG: GGDEF domain-containing protein [Leptospiraceae bacterium]|nr:GGDEF domain-containing protein [Leptospiraceae bacterium]MDW8305845.1 GGDEF domain-containing protein [Leptospiraceae bacterium]